jgi:hypothetical protein
MDHTKRLVFILSFKRVSVSQDLTMHHAYDTE